MLGRHDSALLVNGVEDLTDHMERRGEIRPAVADEDPHLFADAGLERLVANERIDRAVEHDVGGTLIDGLLHVESLQSFLAEFAGRVELALHHVVLLVHRR